MFWFFSLTAFLCLGVGLYVLYIRPNEKVSTLFKISLEKVS